MESIRYKPNGKKLVIREYEQYTVCIENVPYDIQQGHPNQSNEDELKQVLVLQSVEPLHARINEDLNQAPRFEEKGGECDCVS